MPISAANISLRQLTAFAAVVDHGGFAAAAGSLHMTQSAVSQAVMSLERALAGSLLVRDRRSGVHQQLELTALGESTLAHARAVIASVEHLVADATVGDVTTTVPLRVASIRSVALQLLAPARRILMRRHPRLGVNLWEGTDREVHQWMEEGRVDVGLVGPLLTQMTGATVVPLMEDPWYVALPATHTLARGDRICLGQLSDVPYVMADGGCEPAVRALFDRARIAPKVAHRAQSIDTILTMVAGGLGVTLVPELGLQSFDAPTVRTVLLSPPTSRTVAAVMPAGENAPAGAHLLVSALQQHVARDRTRLERPETEEHAPLST